MRHRAIVSLGVSCLLAACAHQSPSAAPSMAWSLHHAEGEGAKLAFGQPQSDNVVLMMTCEPASDDVRLSLAAAPGAQPTIALASRSARGRYQGELTPSIGGASLIEAQAPTSDPTLAAFARTGDLTVVEDGRRTRLPARAADKTVIAGFFKQCESARA